MNYGAEPADQVVRYSLEGTEVALRLSGQGSGHLCQVCGRGASGSEKDPRQKPGWSACCGKASR